MKTEGIFRVPATAGDVKDLKEKIDLGNYDICANTNNVHTPCALLKLWLRELPDALIPEAYYDTCTETPQQGLDVLSKLPKTNQNVIHFIIEFLRRLCQPEVVEVTKMTKDNLAMVFAPSFLRCPYQDYTKAIMAADKEKAFVLFLLNSLPGEEESFVRLTQELQSSPQHPSSTGQLYQEPPDALDQILNQLEE